MTKQEHFISNGNLKIHCIEVNRPQNENCIPLIVIPGAINSAEHMEEGFAGKLSRHHIIVSLRGRGKSDSPKTGYKLGNHVSDVLAVIEELEIKSCYLFGFSIGSTVAIRVASKVNDKVKALIMGDYPPFFPPFDANWAASVRKHEDRDISEIAIDGLANEGEYTEAAGDFEHIDAPVMLVRGGQKGSAFPADAIPFIKKLVPSIRVETLEESAHYIFEPNPEVLIALIEDFLTS